MEYCTQTDYEIGDPMAMLTSDMVTISLRNEEAALFVLFQQHYDNISFLIGSKAFELRKGSFTVDVDPSGNFQRVTKTISTGRNDVPLDN